MHTLLLGVEAALLWTALGWIVTELRSFHMFSTLLPRPAYPIAIALSLMFSIGAAARREATLVAPGWADSMRLAFRQIAAVTCAVFTLAVGMKDPGISRIFLAVYLPTTAACFVVLNRFQPGWLVHLLYGGARLRTLVIGDAELFPELKGWLEVREKFGLEVVGVVRYRGTVPNLPAFQVVGDFADLKAAIGHSRARQVLMLNLPVSADDSEHIARICASCGCRLLIHNNLTFRLSYPLRVLTQDGYSFLAFQDEPLEDPLNRCLKRALDIALALPIVLFVLPPLAVIVAIAHRVQSPGPLFFFQPRSGRGGLEFRIIKFRTMHVSKETEHRQTQIGDARVFGFGRIWRRLSLDELPQFWNVLAGDMSVVGPRPHFVRHDDMFADAVNEYRVRFFVKPGITGLAQSRGLRGEIHTADLIHQRVQLDLAYIHNWTVWLDLTIIVRTFRQLLVPPPTAR